MGGRSLVEKWTGPELKSGVKVLHDKPTGDETLVAELSGLEPETVGEEPQYSHLIEESSKQDGEYRTKTVGAEGELAGSAIQAPDLVNPAAATSQLCADKWPALFADGKTDIHFDDEDFWSFSNEVKGSIESFIGAPVNWWPLSARRRPLPDGFSRVKWKCVSRTFSQNDETSLITLSIQRCGRTLSGIMSTARKVRYEQWFSACNSEPPAQGAPLPPIDRDGGSGTLAGSGSNGTSSHPPPPHQDSSYANGADQGNSVRGQDPTTYKRYLFWCLVSGMGPTVVRSIRVAKDDKDEQVFNNLRVMYHRTRGFWGRVSLHTVAEIRYVRVR